MNANQKLRLQRRLRGWSQEDVALGLQRLAALQDDQPAAMVDAVMVGRWERGTRRPRPRYVRLLTMLFDLPAKELGLVDGAPLLDVVAPSSTDRLSTGMGDAILSRREAEVMSRLAEGRTDMEIAAALQLSVSTVRSHLNQVRDKTGLRRRTELVRWALDQGMGHGGAGLSGIEAWQRLDTAARGASKVDEETVGHLEKVTMALGRLAPTAINSEALVGPVTGHLDTIAMLLQGGLPAALRARLCAVAAETAGLAGWLRWNLDDSTAAAVYFRMGVSAAVEAGDWSLVAWLKGSAACQPPHHEQPQRRVRKLQGSLDTLARSDNAGATEVWLAAKEADAFALMNDTDNCLRALDRADHMLDRLSQQSESEELRRPPMSMVDKTWLAGERGACLARLGQSLAARDILLPVIASLSTESEQDRLWLSVALAQTYVAEREPEEACRVAHDVLVAAAGIRRRPIVAMVRHIRTALERLGATRSMDLLEESIRTVDEVSAARSC